MSRGMFVTMISTAAALVAPLSLLAGPADRHTRDSLMHIKGSAEAASTQAWQLELTIMNSLTSSDVPQAALFELKSEVNAMGREIGKLEAERGSLNRVAAGAVDEVSPLVEDAVRNTQSAILFYNAHKAHLESPEFRGYADKVRLDSEQVAKTIKTFIQNKTAREDERSPEPSDGNAGN